jgi:gamma-D-glutamyl-L-lysine dipeptidyl-peptidase
MMREVAVPVATVWTSPEAPRAVDAAAVDDRPDAQGWADSMDKDVRLGLHGRTDTQLLMGEPVHVLEERDGWSHVAAPWQQSSREGRGYPGWVRSAHLGAPVPVRRGASATVVSPSATCTVDGSAVDLSFGTLLWVAALGEDAATLHLPDGRLGEMPLDDLRLGHTAQSPVYGPDDVLAAARQFLGVRYLWGGSSGWGLDCSGLVHLALRSFSVQVPRDAHDQAASSAVEEVALDDVQPGDLYFFARPGERVYHVGFVTRPVASDGTRWMLHAPQADEHIEDAPMAADRLAHLVSAGRVAKPTVR